MSRNDMFTTKLLPVMTVLLLAACGTAEPAGSDAGGAPDTPVSNTPGSDQTGGGGAQRVESRDGLVDVRPTIFDKFKRRAGGRALDLFFWSGVEECYGVDRVDVRYRRYKVSVTIFEGRDPAAETCIELAVRKVVRVDLDERIGSRAVTDGGS